MTKYDFETARYKIVRGGFYRVKIPTCENDKLPFTRLIEQIRSTFGETIMESELSVCCNKWLEFRLKSCPT